MKIYLTITVVSLIIGFSFYWFQYRPSEIRKECTSTAKDSATALFKSKADLANDSHLREAAQKSLYLQNDYNVIYSQCLSEHGLSK